MPHQQSVLPRLYCLIVSGNIRHGPGYEVSLVRPQIASLWKNSCPMLAVRFPYYMKIARWTGECRAMQS